MLAWVFAMIVVIIFSEESIEPATRQADVKIEPPQSPELYCYDASYVCTHTHQRILWHISNTMEGWGGGGVGIDHKRFCASFYSCTNSWNMFAAMWDKIEHSTLMRF